MFEHKDIQTQENLYTEIYRNKNNYEKDLGKVQILMYFNITHFKIF